MPKPKAHNKGIALMIVLGIIMVVVALSSIVLNNMLSQTRLTHHQVSRIQNYYALQGAMTITYDRMRRGAWAPDPNIAYNNYTFCNGGCTYNDSAFPFPINVAITAQAANGLRTVTFTTDYTYTVD